MAFFRNFSINALGTGLAFALGLLNQSLLANYLGEFTYGRLTLWTSVALLVALVLGEWIRRGSTYVVGRDNVVVAARDNALLYALVLGSVSALVAWIARDYLVAILGDEVLRYWPLLALLTSAVVLQRSGQAVLLGQDRIKRYALLPVVFIAAYTLANVLLWASACLALATVLSAFAAAAALAALVAFAGLGREGAFSWGDGVVLRRTLRVGGRGTISVVLVFLLLRSDFFLIQHFLGEAAVGTYRVAVNFADMMQRLPDVAGAVLLAKVVRDEDVGRMSLRVARGVLAFSLAAALGLLLGGPLFISWLFPAYTEAYTPLVWMLPGLIFLGVGSVFNTKLAGQGYPPITQWAPALAFVLNLLLNMYMIPRWGLRGAALSTSLSYALWAVCIAVAYARSEDVGWRDIFSQNKGEHPTL